MHDARARLFVRRIPAVPVALLAPLVAVPHAAAQLASPTSVGLAAGDARAKLDELLGDGGGDPVANFCDFEHLLRHPKILLESTPPVEEAESDVLVETISFVIGWNFGNEELHGVIAQF